MSLKTQLYQDMKQALKARDAVRLETIRFAIAAIKNFEIDHGEQNDQGVMTIIRKQVKQMKEAIVQFKDGGRQDLVDAETAKLTILEQYLPTPLTPEQVEEVVQKIVDTTKEPTFATVMPVAMKQLGSQAEGKIVAETVRRLVS